MNEMDMRYDVEGGLTMSQTKKAHKLLELGKVKQEDFKKWIVRRVEGYNKHDYRVEIVDGALRCECQYNRLYGKTCSHIMAVSMHIKRGEKNAA